MIELEFNVNKQTLTRTDKEKVVSNSSNIHRCHFKFSSDWNDKEKTATFYKYGVTATVLLDEQNCCFIPSKFLKTSNRMELQVGVFGVNGDSVITSTLVTIPLVGGSDTDGTEVEVEYNLFEQIMQRIDQVKKGEVEPELILAAVNEYISEHPFDDVIVSKIADFVTEHIADLKGDKGDKGADGTSYDDTEIKAEINDIWKATGELGAKNLLKYPYASGESHTVNGMTFTVNNNDGSIVLNGTSTDWTSFYLERNEILKAGEYVVSSNELPQNVYLTFKNLNTSNEASCTQSTQAITLTFNEDIQYRIFLQTRPNVTLNNFVIYPMLRLAANLDNTWKPYAPTNRELNERINNVASGIYQGILDGKKWCVCGDSFTAGDFSNYIDSQGHSGRDSDAYDVVSGHYKTYPWWIGNRNNMNIQWLASAGADFTNIEGAINPFSASDSYYNYTQIASDCDYITIMYGLNERDLNTEQIGTKTDNTNTTLWGAYNVVLTSILTANPTVKIGIIIADAWINQTYHDALIEIANYWGIPYLDLKDGEQVPMMIRGRLRDTSPTAISIRNAAFKISEADSHPNVEGHKYRSTVIENFLRSL